MANEDERKLRESISPRSLQLIVMPTEKCNFRCSYCYEDFSLGRMSSDTIASLKKFMDIRVRGLQILNMEWFGGEPLAAQDIVLDLSEHADRLCQEHGVRLNGSATTNGYLLTAKLAEKLARHSFCSYQITLDGEKDEHDRTRILASGAPTFDRIWSNLIALHKSQIPVRITLRLHLTCQNYNSMKRLVVRIREELLSDPRFSIIVRQIENLGGPNAAAIKPISEEQATLRTRELFSLAYPSLDPGAAAARPPLLICYASRPNSIVVRASGDIAKCTVAFGMPENRVGKLQTNGSINLDNEKMQMWMRGFTTGERSELHCPAQHYPIQSKKYIPIMKSL